MSRARHKEKHRASGGAMKETAKPEWEAGGNTNAAKEAEEKKRGGRVHGEGEHAKHRADRRARGGKVKGHEDMHHKVKGESMHHHEMHHGSHVAGRKRGGGIGSNLTPLTTAARVKHITPGEEPEEGVKSD